MKDKAMKHLIGLLTTLFLLTLCSNIATAQGVLTNGWTYDGTISTAGQSNSYTFTANTGDSVVVRAGALTSLNYFDPWLRVYGPDGALVGSDDPGGGSASEVALTATNSGTFTVLVSDGSFEGYGGTGTYQLSYVEVPGTLVISPGDQGGPLTNGTLNAGTITVGDIDAWSFTANAGDSVVLRAGRIDLSRLFRSVAAGVWAGWRAGGFG